MGTARVACAVGVALAACVASGAIAAPAPRPTVDRFDERGAWSWLARQVALGPRPAGSPASRRLAGLLRAALPDGAFQPVPGGLRNVVGYVPGRDPARFVVVGAHYDTAPLPGFVGANDGASGTAVVVQLARTLRPEELRPSVVFLLFDGEERPRGASGPFVRRGLRGSRHAAPLYRRAQAMILLDMVGDRDLRIGREGFSSRTLWRRVRAAALRVGVAPVFPDRAAAGVLDDHLPFREQGVPAIDLIDFDFRCWHLLCDDLGAVSPRSLDAVGETVYELLRSL